MAETTMAPEPDVTEVAPLTEAENYRSTAANKYDIAPAGEIGPGASVDKIVEPTGPVADETGTAAPESGEGEPRKQARRPRAPKKPKEEPKQE